MIPRPLQKLSGDSISTPPSDHSGDSTRECEFDSYMSYVLTLIKAYSILVCTYITWFFCPLTSVSDEWEESSIQAQVFCSSSHQLTKVHLGPWLESWPT